MWKHTAEAFVLLRSAGFQPAAAGDSPATCLHEAQPFVLVTAVLCLAAFKAYERGQKTPSIICYRKPNQFDILHGRVLCTRVIKVILSYDIPCSLSDYSLCSVSARVSRSSKVSPRIRLQKCPENSPSLQPSRPYHPIPPARDLASRLPDSHPFRNWH